VGQPELPQQFLFLLRVFLDRSVILRFGEAPNVVLDDNMANKTFNDWCIESERPFDAQKGYGLRNQFVVDSTNATMAVQDLVSNCSLRNRILMQNFSL